MKETSDNILKRHFRMEYCANGLGNWDSLQNYVRFLRILVKCNIKVTSCSSGIAEKPACQEQLDFKIQLD